MTKDYRDILVKSLEEREKKYLLAKGMIKGQQLTNLTQADRNMLNIIESLIEFFKTTGNTLDVIATFTLTLEKRISALENTVKELRETLDMMYKNR